MKIIKLVCGTNQMILTDHLVMAYRMNDDTNNYSVVETIEIISNVLTSYTDVSDLKQELDFYKQRIKERRENKKGDRVYIHYKTDADTEFWRSELIDLNIALADDSLDTMWLNKRLHVTITLERLSYYETVNIYSLPLTNFHGTNITSGISVYNVTDTTRNNYAKINGSDILGELPSPLRIELKKSNTGEVSNGVIYLNQLSSPFTYSNILQCEDGYLTGIGTINTVAGYSNNNVLNITFPTNYTRVAKWTLSPSQLSDLKGKKIRPILVLTNSLSNNCYAYFQLEYGGLTPLFKSNELALDTTKALQIFDDFSLSLTTIEDVTIFNITLSLYIKGFGGIGIDYLQLATLDGFRQYQANSMSLDLNYTLVDDQTTEQIYINEGTYGLPFFAKPKGRLYLIPSLDAKLSLIFSYGSSYSPNALYTLKVLYRPRRITI